MPKPQAPKESFTATCRVCGEVSTSPFSKEQAVIMVDIHTKTKHRGLLPAGGVERRGK